jgi:hypothetical protein
MLAKNPLARQRRLLPARHKRNNCPTADTSMGNQCLRALRYARSVPRFRNAPESVPVTTYRTGQIPKCPNLDRPCATNRNCQEFAIDSSKPRRINMGRVGDGESGRVGEWESGESGRVGEWEMERIGLHPLSS